MIQRSPRLACGQIQGDRERQEDEYGVQDFGVDATGRDRLLVVVADGMGGYAGGREAAHTAVGSFLAKFSTLTRATPERLRDALDSANSALTDLKAKKPELNDAGCTLVAAYIENETLSWISVGDSALLLLRSGTLRRLNDDHSMRPVLAELVRNGRMTQEDARTNPNRNALRSALVGDEVALVDLARQPFTLKPGDLILLASDGLETLKPDAITAVLKAGAKVPPAKLVETLLAKVVEAKARHQDNTTVVLYQAKGHARRRLWPKLVVSALAIILVGAAAVLTWWWCKSPAPPPSASLPKNHEVHKVSPASAHVPTPSARPNAQPKPPKPKE